MGITIAPCCSEQKCHRENHGSARFAKAELAQVFTPADSLQEEVVGRSGSNAQDASCASTELDLHVGDIIEGVWHGNWREAKIHSGCKGGMYTVCWCEDRMCDELRLEDIRRKTCRRPQKLKIAKANTGFQSFCAVERPAVMKAMRPTHGGKLDMVQVADILREKWVKLGIEKRAQYAAMSKDGAKLALGQTLPLGGSEDPAEEHLAATLELFLLDGEPVLAGLDPEDTAAVRMHRRVTSGETSLLEPVSCTSPSASIEPVSTVDTLASGEPCIADNALADIELQATWSEVEREITRQQEVESSPISLSGWSAIRHELEVQRLNDFVV